MAPTSGRPFLHPTGLRLVNRELWSRELQRLNALGLAVTAAVVPTNWWLTPAPCRYFNNWSTVVLAGDLAWGSYLFRIPEVYSRDWTCW